MNEPEPVPQILEDLTDNYLNGLLDESGMKELEQRLRADAGARLYFVRYARLHTDLHLEVRAQQASDRALDKIEQLTQVKRSESRGPTGIAGSARIGSLLSRCLTRRVLIPAACLLLAVGAGVWFVNGRLGQGGGGRELAIAWLVNAQNCRWSEGEPAGDLQAGTNLNLEQGLVEIRFQCGARIVLEGPASLELLSQTSARLKNGKLTARVPTPTTGFAIVSPQGKVIDLGTEFGISVSEKGGTEVYVFEGKVEARSADKEKADAVSLTQNQAARIDAGKVTLKPSDVKEDAGRFVRAILPPPVIVPRSFRLNFKQSLTEGILDANGACTGLTHRLPGTGSSLPKWDPNWRLDPAKGHLELTTTNSDINTQFKLHHGEYLGVRLADLGFTGKEDFAVTATIPDIPPLEKVGQFGLYAGARSDRNIRGGLISSGKGEFGQYTQFLVNNNNGEDADPNLVGLLSTGTDLRLTLERSNGKYALTVENLTTGSKSTLSIRHPEFLDNEQDLFVGLFGANTQSEVRRKLFVKEFQATVWTVSPSPRQ
jgi:ferric-dicitrate binding protein FerR (iron transport regulator)